MTAGSYRVNAPTVIYEAFEDETLLINLGTGNYYGFSGSGALIWNCIMRGDSVNSVVDNLQNSFGNKDGIAPAVEDFVRELVEENLIVEIASEPAKAWEEVARQTVTLDRFERPSLQKYTDMQDLLLLDPIHEVDETGWPNALLPKPSGKQVE